MNERRTTLGLIAGSGRLPRDIATAARENGYRVVAVAIRGSCDPSLGEDVDELHWLDLGQLECMLKVFQDARAQDAVMAGKVFKRHLFGAAPGGEAGNLNPDGLALRVLASLADRSDDSILGALADVLGDAGIQLRPQAQFVPELVPGEGPLGKCRPTPEQWRDIEFGFGVAKALGRQDVGQSVVVKHQAIMAVEAIEGTDAAIRRGGQLAGPGACVIKVSKPAQDPRFDLPVVGPDTLEAMKSTGVAALAFEADATLVLDRETLVAGADATGIAVVGVSEASVARELRLDPPTSSGVQ